MTQYTICIPTYKRTGLLEILLNDITQQSVIPHTIIIVDGYPSSKDVLPMLERYKANITIKSVVYIPSNHGNLSYQRYLGYRAAKIQHNNYLLYLDDDLRIFQRDAIEKLLSPMIITAEIVGSSSMIRNGELDNKFADFPALLDRSKVSSSLTFWTRWLGASRDIQPGGLTPIGDRVPPKRTGEEVFSPVQWLRGGVMLYRMDALNQECFSDDLFALYHIRCSKGEDTFLSRRVMNNGKLIYHFDVIIDHPNSDLPRTYPITAYHLAYATAYSRRFLNDHYRVTEMPHFSDGLALVKSYLGNNLINLIRALMHPRRHRFAYAWGYFIGSLRGILQKPTAKNLTPEIDWWKDAEEALHNIVVIK